MTFASAAATYELGYRAAAAGRPRKVLRNVRQILPSVSSEWFRGYDEALSNTEAERALTLASVETGN